MMKIESSLAEIPIVSYGRIQVTLVGDSLLNETFTLTKWAHFYFNIVLAIINSFLIL